ncbi:armadillo repeat-containing protein 7 isoform X3 [Globicephala melas]|uniref:armadillo repeat-containing protein 7 isoform X3 n=1 Tax=Globicephala melas TaxID=9731 RepID=UPI00293D7742|nr:armadillo repeat-containing protein 7 isoform X4 [Globicephala melas]
MAQKPKVDPHVGRLGYLQALVTEFQATESQDAKEQVLANLANFAYDPSNYQYLRQLQVLDLFLDSLSEENETLVEFAIGSKAWGAGLCRSIWHRKMLFATGTDKLGQHQVGSASRHPCLGGLKGQRLWTVYWPVRSRLGKP